MTAGTAVAIGLAPASSVLTNLAYLREHDAVAALPPLSMRRPLHAIAMLLEDRSWAAGFALETTGFLLYAAALALAPLALVQSLAAGGIGVLAYFSARLAHRRLSRREWAGVAVSVVGLAALGVSLSGGTVEHAVSIGPVLIWLGGTAVAAFAVARIGRRRLGAAAADGIAGGLLFSIGDISTKLVTQGGARVAFLVTLVLGYTLGTTRLQLGYQAGAALTVAGIATLLTNALPIAAGTVVLGEDLPAGGLGVLRIVAFVAVCAGTFLIARPAPAGK